MSGVRDPIELMRQETRIGEGDVAQSLAGVVVEPGRQHLAGTEFLLREDRFAVHYRQGQGITIARQPGSTLAEEELYLHGSVYAAIACINGFMPLHASAVAVGGRVVAFTGPAGAGKSTLVAGLTRLGLPLFCDDTLVLDISGDGPVMCLPGHKRLKLWPDALDLTGNDPLGLVSENYKKFYASPAGGEVSTMLPLAALGVLEAGEPHRIEQVRGGAKIAALGDDHYSREMFEKVRAMAPETRFAVYAGIAERIRIFRFVRSLDRSHFQKTTSYLSRELSTMIAA